MFEIRIPRLGWSMEEGTLVGWLKRPGDVVAVGEPLFELEGEKALQDVESVDAGTLFLPADSPQVGSVVAVGALLGYLLMPGEVMSETSTRQRSPSDAPIVSAKGLPAQPVSAADSTADRAALAPSAGPSVRRLARELGVNLNDVAGTGKSGRVTGEDLVDHDRTRRESITTDDRRMASGSKGTSADRVASPRAKRIAGELGIDWTTLQGTGRDGRIRESDVRAACVSVSRAHTAASRGLKTVVISSRRKSIADRLRISRDRTIPVTLTAVADATNLAALREQFKSMSPGIVPAYTDIAACLVGRVLKRHPQVASRRDDGHQSLHPISVEQYSIGIAVDTTAGLLVPVVRDVTRKSLSKVAEETRLLIARARSGRLTSVEMQGGNFTITNLGGFGIDAFTPIINYPEIAILGLGTIRREAVVMPDDRIVPQSRITLSLTFDHSAIDGAPAAAFLRDVTAALENPAPHLLGD